MALTKKTINLGSRALTALEELTKSLDVNDTDAINRALILTNTLREYMTDDGLLKITDPRTGETVCLILL